MKPPENHASPPEQSNEIRISRRRLLKAMAATGGAVAASTLLPGKWAEPLVEAGLLPAHAQASPTPTPVLGTGDLQVTVTWDTATDVDTHVVEPDGTHVCYWRQQGTTAELDVDDTSGYGPENIYVPAGGAAAGTYEVFVVYYSDYGLGRTTATIRITVFADTPQEQVQTFTRDLATDDPNVGHNVADVTFPAGTITETTGTRSVPASPEGPPPK